MLLQLKLSILMLLQADSISRLGLMDVPSRCEIPVQAAGEYALACMGSGTHLQAARSPMRLHRGMKKLNVHSGTNMGWGA